MRSEWPSRPAVQDTEKKKRRFSVPADRDRFEIQQRKSVSKLQALTWSFDKKLLSVLGLVCYN